MTLNELHKGDRAVVLKIDLSLLVKERLRALGIYTGEPVLVLKVSLRKNVFLVQATKCGSKVALDLETAAGVAVWKI